MTEKTSNQPKKKKSIFKRILKGLGIFLFLIVLAAVAIPYFFKDRILDEVQKVINENVRAKIEFSDVGVGMLRSFPDITLSLEGLKVDGIEEFKGIRLADIKSFETRLDIMSIINGELMEIERITLDEPMLYVKVMENGKANYDITIPTEELDTMEAEPMKFALNLDEYTINNGKIIYDDAVSDVWVDIVNLNHTGNGNFTEAIYDLATKTTADKFTLSSGNVTYLNEAKTDIDFTINIDMPNSKYTFKENEVNFNALKLNFDGFVAMPGDDIEMDLKFGSPQTDFKSLLSMIPAAYTSDFSGVKASGKMGLDGTVKGIYNASKMPALDINLSVANGSFKYPDLPLGMSNINVKANVKSPNANFDNMVVNVPKFHIELDKNPFDAKFVLKTPMSDPNVNAEMKGKIDLAKLAKAFPMEGVKTLDGIINADIATKMKMSDVTAEKYDNVDFSGEMTITNMNYVADGMPNIKINDLTTEFTPQKINLDNFDANLGKSDLQVTGFVENPLTYFSGEKTMNGDLVVRSKKFDVNEWMEGSEPSQVQNPDADAIHAESEDEGIFDKFLFNVDAEFGQLIYDGYDMKNMKAKGAFAPAHFDIENFAMNLGKSDLQASGQIKNAFGYVFDGETVKGDIALKSNKLDLNEIMEMGVEEGSTTESKPNETKEESVPTEPEGEVFGRFDFMVDVDAKEINYDVYDLENLTAKGHLGHNEFDIENFGTKIGESDINGSARIFNALNYAFKPNETVSGDLVLNSKLMDLNDLMSIGVEEGSTTETATTTSETAATEPALIPSDMNFNIKANMGKVLYDKVTLNSMTGDLILKDSKVSMKDVRANTLGGSMKLNGSYDTKDVKNPKFAFGYDISQFQFEQSVKELASFKYILPIAEYMQGQFNSELTINGVLGKDMMPKWETLNASGILETVETAIKGNPTLDKIVNQLNASELNPFKVKDSKNFFEIKDGKFSIKPFTVKYKDVVFEIGGSHGINQSLDYTINTKIPRAMLEKSGVGAAANKGLDLLNGQASKLGLNLAQGDYIDLDVLLTGAIADPKYKLKLKGIGGKSDIETAAKQKLEEEAEKLKKEAEERLAKEKAALEGKAKAEADKLKKEAEAKAKAEADRLKKEAEARAKAEADRLKKEAEERIKKELGDKASAAAKAEAERLKKEAQKRIDDETKRKLEEEKKKIQEQLDKYNPFKKKKGGGEK
ncbi:MAG: AsmA-like C-terminal region-containing protein [Saprospiraceae bacterium]